jgi:hypothetical protein
MTFLCRHHKKLFIRRLGRGISARVFERRSRTSASHPIAGQVETRWHPPVGPTGHERLRTRHPRPSAPVVLSPRVSAVNIRVRAGLRGATSEDA